MLAYHTLASIRLPPDQPRERVFSATITHKKTKLRRGEKDGKEKGSKKDPKKGGDSWKVLIF